QPEVTEVLGQTLVGRYKKLASYNVCHDGTFRRNWTAKFIEASQSLMRDPEKRFPAKSAKAVPYRTLADGRIRPSPIRIKYRDETLVLRPDQVVSARRWNVWFDFQDALLERAYDEFLVETARQELNANIQSLWNIEATYLSGRSN